MKTETQLLLSIPQMTEAEMTGGQVSAVLRRSLFMLRAAAEALDKNGNQTAPIVMWRADYQRVRRHFGGKPRTTVLYAQHPVLNGWPSSKAARARLCSVCGERPGQPETCNSCAAKTGYWHGYSQVQF